MAEARPGGNGDRRVSQPGASRRGAVGRHLDGSEAGQIMPMFAFGLMAMVAMLALVIDIGVLYGQHRYAQNGADAAALAAGRLLLREIAAHPGDSNAPADATIYDEVRRYAGLGTSGAAPASPAVNQQPGLLHRTNLVATLEYNNTGNDADWCTSPASLPTSPPAPIPPSCGPGRPAPIGGLPYRLRVGVSATTNGFFARAIGLGDLTPPGCRRPASAQGVELAGVRGITTCALAAVTVSNWDGGSPTVILTQ